MSEAVNKVPLLDLRRVPTAIDEQMLRTFERVLKSGQYILGPEVDALEKECAAYCGTRFALGVSSGTDALIMALLAFDIGAGDEVICPTYSFFATAGAIWRTGAKPVFVDVEPGTFNMDPKSLSKAITPRTKAIMPVHLFGQCADIDAILAIAADAGLPVIEDAAQAIGAERSGRRAGAFGAIGCFSFFPSKNLGAMGDAGFVTTNDQALYDKLKIIRVHGGVSEYHHAMVGGNFRIDALQAALVRVKLPLLDASTEGRQRNAQFYTKALTDAGIAGHSSDKPLTLPAATTGRHIFNQYVVVVNDAAPGDKPNKRDALQAALKEKNVASKVYYPVPLHLQACFASLGYKPGQLPTAERLAQTSLALPIFPELSQAELQYTVDAIVAALR